MLRTLLLFIVLLIVLVIALVGFGVINLRQDSDGVAIETRDVEFGTTPADVEVPVVRMENRTLEVPNIEVNDGNQAVNAQ
ncbi:MAG: hypothetical protein ACXWU1_12895 [Allosphingosinicella sp.]